MDNAATKIQPLEYLVLTGFQQRFQQVFGCVQCAFINANDKTKILERLFGKGKPLAYPYATFEIKSYEENEESYNPHYLMRRGLVLNVDSSSTFHTVRIIPTNFEIEVVYTTNKFESVDQGSVMAFARRWLLARRGGYLKTSVDYGRLQLGIGVEMPKQVQIPSRGNIVETETSFEITTNVVIHGYTSEPVLGTKGKVNQFNVNGSVGTPSGGTVVSSQFFAFPEKS